jgi:hypothetical protein
MKIKQNKTAEKTLSYFCCWFVVQNKTLSEEKFFVQTI